MPSRRAAALLVLAASTLAACGDPTTPGGALRAGASRGVSNLDVPRDAFRPEFEAILATIDQSYGLKTAKGIGVGDLRARFGPDIDRAASPEAFYAVLLRLFSALHNSHSGLVLPAAAFGFAGMTTAVVGDRLLVASQPTDAVLADHGVGRGWEVAAIDDAPIAEWIAGRSELVSASTTQYGRVAAAAQATRRFWFEPVARRFTLCPGDAVHIPTHASHWVQNHDSVSVSVSLNMEFPRRFADTYRANYYLRRFGIKPRPPGKSKVVDSSKAAAINGLRHVKSLVKR